MNNKPNGSVDTSRLAHHEGKKDSRNHIQEDRFSKQTQPPCPADDNAKIEAGVINQKNRQSPLRKISNTEITAILRQVAGFIKTTEEFSQNSATFAPFTFMRLYQNQIWRKGTTSFRIVHLERLAVEYKEINDSAPDGGKHVSVTKKEFCRLIKGATLEAD